MSNITNLLSPCRTTVIILCITSLPFFALAQSKSIKVIEIRNYLLKQGRRDSFINVFETLLMDTLNAKKNYVLGQYQVKNENDRFTWFRGFDDMLSRKGALEGFYSSAHWKKNENATGKHLIGYTNVYLLKPLSISTQEMDSSTAFDVNWFGKPKGVTVVDFYVANEMRAQLLDFVQTKYDSIVRAAGVKDISYWISETTPNNYPNLPVFQDKNLLVTIAFYKDEQEYASKKMQIEASMNEEQKFRWNRVVTTKTTWVLYPTKASFITSMK